MADHILKKVGQHYNFQDLEFWAEDGLIFIEDRRQGDFNIVTCRDFVDRAKAINGEAKLSLYPSDVEQLQACVLKMHAAWKEAKEQGDPMDVEVAKRKYRERRRATMVTGMW